MSPRRPTSKCVTVVSGHAETREALRVYLDESGIEAHALGAAEVGRIARGASAVVLFPDDFPERRARAFTEAMRRQHPDVLLIVVTREPQRLATALAHDARSVVPLVLPRPSFGWSILDAIRAHEATVRGPA